MLYNCIVYWKSKISFKRRIEILEMLTQEMAICVWEPLFGLGLELMTKSKAKFFLRYYTCCRKMCSTGIHELQNNKRYKRFKMPLYRRIWRIPESLGSFQDQFQCYTKFFFIFLSILRHLKLKKLFSTKFFKISKLNKILFYLTFSFKKLIINMTLKIRHAIIYITSIFY